VNSENASGIITVRHLSFLAGRILVDSVGAKNLSPLPPMQPFWKNRKIGINFEEDLRKFENRRNSPL
jgi:hypothetical protein